MVSALISEAVPVRWIRHGTSLDGQQRPAAHAHPDSPLSERGTREILRAADHLRRSKPALIVSSPLRRAWASATVLAGELLVPLAAPLAEAAEWRAPDCVLGLTPEQYPPDYRAWRHTRATDPGNSLPGGESLHQFAGRAAAAHRTAEAIAAHKGSVLVVSHRILIGAVAALTAGIDDPAEIFHHARRFSLRPAAWWCVGC